MHIQPPLKSQAKSLLSYPSHAFQWYSQAYRWRRTYGRPRGPKCNGSYCWVLLWGDDQDYEADHVSFKTIRSLAPRIDCFIYERSCGCTNRWWGSKVWIRANCEKHGLNRLGSYRLLQSTKDSLDDPGED